MAYNEDIAKRIRNVMADRSDMVEKKMFGGLAFMVRGHMCSGTNGDELMVRVGLDDYEALLKKTCPGNGLYRTCVERNGLCRFGRIDYR